MSSAFFDDSFDDLTTVNQGTQTRSFTYDSLKRLTSATNPESNTVNYTSYDANGNLLSKTDARGITTSYAYDALNRVAGRSYSDLTTPAVNYSYDSIAVANSRGRLTQVSSSVSTTNYGSYDTLGRVTGRSQTTNGQTYSLGYSYDLAGNVTTQTYPSGRIVTTNYDAAGRVNAVSGQKTGEANKMYASSLSYAPQQAINSMTLGNGLVEATSYNNRLQLTSIGVGSLASFVYGYGTTNNNGNVLSQQIIVPGFTVTQSYSSDPLNRLTTVCEPFVSGACAPSGWSQTYGYDPFGNRTSVTSPTYMPTYAPAPAISAANNRISDPSFAYDGSGNLTQAPPAPGAAVQTFAYDAENKLINFNGGTTTYAYDGDGHRVKKVIGSTTTVFVYNTPGQLVAEYTTPAPTTAGGTSYLTADHLGSTRVVTNQSGSVIARHDYLPFGEEIPSGIGGRTTTMGYGLNDGINQKFTGQIRDTESGLDYFGARYYASAQGRWLSPDWSAGPTPVPYADFSDPQSLNLYGYVRNNPITNYDPDGHICLFGFLGNTCHKDDPPPPPPPPPPPAVITPGTPQYNLANAQDAARNDPKFAPQPPPDNRTFCNLATCSIVKATGAPTEELINQTGTPNLANTDAKTLANSPQWRPVSPQEAQNLADQGVTVVAVQSNPGRHGHIATVRPELLPGTAQSLGVAPIINNIGRRREIEPATQAFPDPTRPVRYYAPKQK